MGRTKLQLGTPSAAETPDTPHKPEHLGFTAMQGFEVNWLPQSLGDIQERFSYSKQAQIANTALALAIGLRFAVRINLTRTETECALTETETALSANFQQLAHEILSTFTNERVRCIPTAIVFSNLFHIEPVVELQEARGYVRDLLSAAPNDQQLPGPEHPRFYFIKRRVEAFLDYERSNEEYEARFCEEEKRSFISRYDLDPIMFELVLDPYVLKEEFKSFPDKTGFRPHRVLELVGRGRALGLPGFDKIYLNDNFS